MVASTLMQPPNTPPTILVIDNYRGDRHLLDALPLRLSWPASPLRGYLGSLWVLEALQGTTPQEAFIVTCDQSIMTSEDIRSGHLICLVGVAVVTAAEFTFYRIHINQKAQAAVPL